MFLGPSLCVRACVCPRYLGVVDVEQLAISELSLQETEQNKTQVRDGISNGLSF
jgi:hypothetical protein